MDRDSEGVVARNTPAECYSSAVIDDGRLLDVPSKAGDRIRRLRDPVIVVADRVTDDHRARGHVREPKDAFRIAGDRWRLDPGRDERDRKVRVDGVAMRLGVVAEPDESGRLASGGPRTCRYDRQVGAIPDGVRPNTDAFIHQRPGVLPLLCRPIQPGNAEITTGRVDERC